MAMRIRRAPNQIYSPQLSPLGDSAKQQYDEFRGFVNPIQQKIMYPTLALSLLTDPSINPAIIKGAGKLSPALGKFAEDVAPALGPLGAAAYLLPKALSETNRGYRHRAERRDPNRMKGFVGGTLGALETISSIDFLTRLPGWTSTLAGMPQDFLLKKSPRIANWLTGTAGNVMAGKGGAAVEGGGILSSLYEGAKKGADFATGGHVSSALASGAKKGGLAGIASSGAGLVDKGIAGLLSSPTGLMMGMAGLQVGLAIYKSVKMAKLQPRREPPDKFARKFYNPSQSASMLNKVLAMGSTGKIDPQTMSFMIQQIQLQELIRLNMQVAGFRGEYHSENDFSRQEKDKGTDKFGGVYGSEVYGEDDRGSVLRFLDWLDYKVTSAKEKYDPFTQMTKFLFGLTRGKLILPGQQKSEIQKVFGYDDESEAIKEKAEQCGVSLAHMRLLHTSAKSIMDMAPTYEAKVLAILAATYDLQRYGYTKEFDIKEADRNPLKEALAGFFGKINPLNLPGINALWNVGKGAAKFAFKTIPSIPQKMKEGIETGVDATKRFAFGEGYEQLRSEENLLKAADLYKDSQEKAFDFIGSGLPGVLAELRQVQFSQLEVQQNILSTQIKMLELQGEMYEYNAFQGDKKDLLVWDSVDGRFLTKQEAKRVEKTRQLKLITTKEEAFAKGPLGKLMFLADFLTAPITQLGKTTKLGAGIKRTLKAEDVIGELEERITGEQETFSSVEMSKIASLQLSSLQPRVSVKATSAQEEDIKRRLKFSFRQYMEQLGAGTTIVGLPLMGMILGSGGIGALLGLTTVAGYVGYDLWKRRGIAATAAKHTGYLTPEEELIAKLREESKKDSSVRAGEREANIITGVTNKSNPIVKRQDPAEAIRDAAYYSKLQLTQISSEIIKRQDLQLEELKKIASYLGSDKSNVYDLLYPSGPYAEVTVVDKFGRPVFIGGSDRSPISGIDSHMQLLHDIVDRLGKSNDRNVYTALAPTPLDPVAEVQLNKDTIKALTGYDENQIKLQQEIVDGLLAKSFGSFMSTKMLDVKKRAEGGPIDKDKPVLVGEEGPEILMPRSAGVIIPNDKIQQFAEGGVLADDRFDIFGKMYQTLQDMLAIDKKSLDIEIYQEKKETSDMHNQSIFEKLNALKEKTKQKAQDVWQNKVLAALTTKKEGVKKYFADKKEKEDKGIFGSIFDYIKGSPKIMGGLLAALTGALGKLVWDLFGDETKQEIKTQLKGFLLEKFNELSTGSLAATGAAAGAALGVLGGIPGMVTGAIVGASIGTVVSMIRDSFKESDKTGGDILSGFQNFLTGSAAGEIASVGGNAAKWAAIGAPIGAAAGAIGGLGFAAFPGFFIGALIGGTLGSVLAIWKNFWIDADKGNTKSSFLTDMFTNVNAEIIEMFNTSNPLAGRFAQYGAFTIPVIGPLIGGIFGSAISGILELGGFFLKSTDIGKQLVDKVKKEYPNLYKFFFARDEGTESSESIAQRQRDTAYKSYISEYKKAYDAGDIAQAEALTDNYFKMNKMERPKTGYGSKVDLAKAFANKGKEKSTTGSKTADASTKTVTMSQTTGEAQAAPVPTSVPTQAPNTTSSTPIVSNVSVAAALKEASEKTKVPLDTLTRIADIETGGTFNPKSISPTGCRGLFQFDSTTWKRMVDEVGKPKYGLDRNTNIFDPRPNALMGAEYYKLNEDAIRGKTFNNPPTATDVYIAHNIGAGGASALFKSLRNNPNSPPTGINNDHMKSNSSFFFEGGKINRRRLTARESYEMYSKKMKQPIDYAALEKAGSGTFGKVKDIASDTWSGVKDFAKSAVDKAPQKAKNVLEILGRAGEKIKDKFMEALFHESHAAEAPKANVGQADVAGLKAAEAKLLGATTPTATEQQAQVAPKTRDQKLTEIRDKLKRVGQESLEAKVISGGAAQSTMTVMNTPLAQLSDAEKESRIRELVAQGKPILLRELRKIAEEKGYLKVMKEKDWSKQLSGQLLNPMAMKQDIEDIKVEKKHMEAMEALTKQDMSKPAEVAKGIQERAKEVLKLVETEKKKIIENIPTSKSSRVMSPPAIPLPVKEGSLGISISPSLDRELENLFGSVIRGFNKLTEMHPHASVVTYQV